jgi:hypothetical protein
MGHGLVQRLGLGDDLSAARTSPQAAGDYRGGRLVFTAILTRTQSHRPSFDSGRRCILTQDRHIAVASAKGPEPSSTAVTPEPETPDDLAGVATPGPSWTPAIVARRIGDRRVSWKTARCHAYPAREPPTTSLPGESERLKRGAPYADNDQYESSRLRRAHGVLGAGAAG